MVEKKDIEQTTTILGRNVSAGVKLQKELKPSDGGGSVSHITWSPDGNILVAGYSGAGYYWANTGNLVKSEIRIWSTETWQVLQNMGADTREVNSASLSPDGSTLALASYRQEILLWSIQTNPLFSVKKLKSLAISKLTGLVQSFTWSTDSRTLVCGCSDGSVRFYNIQTRRQNRNFSFGKNPINRVMLSPSGTILLTFSSEARAWDVKTGKLLREFHFVDIASITAWSPDDRIFTCSFADRTIHIFDTRTLQTLAILEGHTSSITDITFTSDSKILASRSSNGNVRVWNTYTWETLAVLSAEEKPEGRSAGLAFHPSVPLLAIADGTRRRISIWNLDLAISLARPTMLYKNAKIVLIGDSGVGKSGLSLVLTHQTYIPTDSTHARHVWTFEHQEVKFDEWRTETRETLLWDLAGQPGYRLVHQLSLHEVAVAVVVFDAQNEIDPFAGVKYWNKALHQAQIHRKLLVAARIDRGGVAVSHERVQCITNDLGFAGYFEASAKEGWQIDELRTALSEALDWENLPKVSSTALFQQIKKFLVEEVQQAKRQLSTMGDLYSTFLKTKDAPTDSLELLSQFETCVGQLDAVGLIRQLSFGKLVLLQPELLDAYASALVNVVKDEPEGLGSITEEQVRAGNFRMPAGERIRDVEQEKLLLIAMIEDLLRRELVLREEGMLVFPSQSTKTHPDLPDPPGKAVVFSFEGPVLNIYTTLAVRLKRTGLFKAQDLWKNAVTYTTGLNNQCGMHMRNIDEGRGELTLFFDKGVSGEIRQWFEEFVYLHLAERSLTDSLVVRHIVACSSDKCSQIISDETWRWCPACGTPILREPQHTIALSTRTQALRQFADYQRDREAAQVSLQGKIVTGTFDVFLCYNSADKEAVKKIGEQLKDWGILPWMDEWELRPGLPWQDLLEKQIESIKTAAVFVGKDNIGPWQRQELAAFLREFVDRNCPVIPILLADVALEPRLPVFLNGMTWVDFRIKEPDPMEQIYWGITGHHYKK